MDKCNWDVTVAFYNTICLIYEIKYVTSRRISNSEKQKSAEKQPDAFRFFLEYWETELNFFKDWNHVWLSWFSQVRTW